MFGSDVLDIAVGLVLVYLLMSLIMTAVQEAIEGLLKTRSHNLEKSIEQLLKGDKALVRSFYEHPLIFALYEGAYVPGTPAAARRKNLPSYIPRETFSAVFADMVGKGGTNAAALAPIGDHLKALAGDDIDRFRRELESWYDGAMDRASGWYKRNTQTKLFFLGLGASLLLNVNSITVAQHLSIDSKMRERVVAIATKTLETDIPADKQVQEFDRQVRMAGLPIGWNNLSLARATSGFPDYAQYNQGWWWIAFGLLWVGALLVLLVGYLITAFAVMLGAPFWFDVLNKIMVIRATVKPKEKSPDEASEDRQKKPKTSATNGGQSTSGKS
jgi:hypothetical protein